MKASDELVGAVADELSRRRRAGRRRVLGLASKVIVALAALAAIASGLHDLGMI
jgi:hypothetical protein